VVVIGGNLKLRRSYAFSAGIFGIQRPEEPLRAGEPVIRLVQRQNHLGGFADDPSPLNQAKITGIEAVIAVVSPSRSNRHDNCLPLP
jgi:hypothetical protein